MKEMLESVLPTLLIISIIVLVIQVVIIIKLNAVLEGQRTIASSQLELMDVVEKSMTLKLDPPNISHSQKRRTMWN